MGVDEETINSSDLGRLLKALSVDEPKEESFSEHVGKIIEFDQNGLAWCQLDGAEEGELTPVENLTMTSKIGDNILITIEDGIATGSPSPNNQMVTADYVNAVVSAMAGDTSSLEEYLQHGNFEDITAQKASFGDLDSDTATIGNLTVDTANITNLEATNARLDNAIVNSLSAVVGKFEALEATSAKMKGIIAEWIKAARLEVEKLIANEATIADLRAENANIVELIASDAYLGNLIANNATFQSLATSKADIDLANIDIANIAAAKIQELMAGSGWFTQDLAVTGDSTVTGQLKAVLIDGDTARFRNIYADALMIQGQNGLYHRLNFDGLDDTTYNFVQVDSDGTKNPMEQNWYELFDGQYVRTTDENEIVAGSYPVERINDGGLFVEDGFNKVFTFDSLESGSTITVEYVVVDRDGDMNKVVSSKTATFTEGISGTFSEWSYEENHGGGNSNLIYYDGERSLSYTCGDASQPQVRDEVWEDENFSERPFIYVTSISYVMFLDEDKTYYVTNGLADQEAQALVDSYGSNLDVGLHGSHILAESITATQIDASSVRASLLEASEIQIGSNAVSHIRMHEGLLGFYPGSTIVYNEVLQYEPVVDPISTTNPSNEGWYVLYDDEYVLTSDTSVNSSTTYYELDESYALASPRSRRWYELDENIGYYRSVDSEIVPNKKYYDGSEASVAYITNQELYIPRAVVTDKMAIGTPDLGQWVWEISDDQNLSLTWGGRYGGGAS